MDLHPQGGRPHHGGFPLGQCAHLQCTIAGTEYTIASSSVAAQLSALNGGGVGQVVTLLLGMNDQAVSVLTGDAADQVFYGVVQNHHPQPH